MVKTYKNILLFILLLISAAQANIGGYAGAFLQRGAGVRVLGMGNAFTGLANDASASFWNPAGLGQIGALDVTFSYSHLSLDRKYNYIGAAVPFFNAGTMGFSWINYGVNNVEKRDKTGLLLGTLSNDEYAFLFSYGIQAIKHLNVGGSLKTFYHLLDYETASGIGFDLGVHIPVNHRIQFGAVVQNLGARLFWDSQFNNYSERMPASTRFGINLCPFHNINLACDYEIINIPGQELLSRGNYFTGLYFGGELTLAQLIVFRLGYAKDKLTFGTSLAPVPGRKLKIDYAYMADPVDLSTIHRFGVSLSLEQQKRRRGFRSRYETLIVASTVIRIQGNLMEIDLGKWHGLKESVAITCYRNIDNTKQGLRKGYGKVITVFDDHALIELYGSEAKDKPEKGEKIAIKYNVTLDK